MAWMQKYGWMIHLLNGLSFILHTFLEVPKESDPLLHNNILEFGVIVQAWRYWIPRHSTAWPNSHVTQDRAIAKLSHVQTITFGNASDNLEVVKEVLTGEALSKRADK
ncbi:hypothetical protein IW262DRAFT_1451302 [Armillaria fumosa]|nr:hypothetical protein IW262DRAFT_1451302 [Armillaria fumosa]